MPPRDPLDEIASFHAHVYYDPATIRPRPSAADLDRPALCASPWVAGMTSRSGRTTRPCFRSPLPRSVSALVPWLMLNHGSLSILVHPNTSNPRRDHLADPLWIGTPLAVHGDKLPERCRHGAGAGAEYEAGARAVMNLWRNDRGWRNNRGWTSVSWLSKKTPGGNHEFSRQRAALSATHHGPARRKQKPLGEQIMKVSSVGIGGPYNSAAAQPGAGAAAVRPVSLSALGNFGADCGSTSSRSSSSAGNGVRKSNGSRTRRSRRRRDCRPTSSPS